MTQDELDARRYRWLKQVNPMAIVSIAWSRRDATRFGVDAIDDAVDAAMEQDDRQSKGE
jgi:hypothetical protein